MHIEVTPESHTTSIEVEDSELVAAYERGGMDAVKDLLVKEADANPEGAFLWPTAPAEEAVQALCATFHAAKHAGTP